MSVKLAAGGEAVPAVTGHVRKKPNVRFSDVDCTVAPIHFSNLIVLARVSSRYKSSLGHGQVVGWSNLAVSMHPYTIVCICTYISWTSPKGIAMW